MESDHFEQLQRFSRGEISYRRLMDMLDIETDEALFLEMCKTGLPIPQLPEEEAAAMVQLLGKLCEGTAMDGQLWSLRNKFEDLEQAVRDGDHVLVKMAVHELGMRLNHAEAAWQSIKAQLAGEPEENRKIMAARIEELRADLGHYAALHGGRFILFGSAARGDFNISSDIDILVDFPEDKEDEAWRYAEDACYARRLKQDIRPKRWCSQVFLDRALRYAEILGEAK